jgi:hypothetical protein
MADVVDTIFIVIQLGFSIAALLWYPFEIGYRFYHSRRSGIGYWDIDTPMWHKIVFWPIILGLFLIFSWKLFF